MKQIIIFLFFLFLGLNLNSQSPLKMSYQAVVRSSSNELVKSSPVGMRISILQGSATGIEVYKEIFNPNPQTNSNGLVTIEIGAGTVIAGIFANIDWSSGPYFLKTETDPTGGTNYTITGTSQLLSVPYALHAQTAESISGGIAETDPVYTASPSKGITAGNITNWNNAFGWGNHTGLYRPLSYVPAWAEISSNPFSFTSVSSNQLIRYNSTTGKWENWSPTYLTSYTETDPVWTVASSNYYTKTNLQTSGGSQVHFGNITNKPTTLAGYGITDAFNGTWVNLTGKPTTIAGYGITDAMSTSHAANAITATNITNWNTAYSWGNHSGLYRPIGYVPVWSEITANPFLITSAANNQLLKYNSISGKWENWTPNFITGYTEADPAFVAWNKSTGISITASQVSDFQSNVTNNSAVIANTAKNNYPAADATKLAGIAVGAEVNVNSDWNASSGDAQVINKPATLAGYGITDAVNTTGDQTIAGKKTFSNMITGALNANNTIISNVANPTSNQDAATKSYVDALKSQIEELKVLLGRVKDIDGNVYNTVNIGNQEWMVENLKTTKYRNGDLVGTTNPPNLDISGEINPKYQWAPQYNISNVIYFGRLYTWDVVNDSRGICPVGWHAPSDSEWTILTDYLTNNGYGYQGSGDDVAKSIASAEWWDTYSTSGGAIGYGPASNNSSGFSGVPAGYRASDGSGGSIGNITYWWSSTEYDATRAWLRWMIYNQSVVIIDAGNKLFGNSIRCLRD